MRKTFKIVFLLWLFLFAGTQFGWAQGTNVFDQGEGATSWVSDFFKQDSGWSFDRFDLDQSNVWDADYFAQPEFLAAANGSGGGSGGGPPLKPDGTIDLEAISKSMDNPLGNLWIIFTQNDTLTLRGPPFQKTQVANVFTLMPILPIPLTKDWLLVNRPIMSFINLNKPDFSAAGQGRFPDLSPGGGQPFPAPSPRPVQPKWETSSSGMPSPQKNFRIFLTAN